MMMSLRWNPGQVRDAQPLPFSKLRSASLLLSLMSGDSSVSVPCTAANWQPRQQPLLLPVSELPSECLLFPALLAAEVHTESFVNLGRDGPSRCEHHDMRQSWSQTWADQTLVLALTNQLGDLGQIALESLFP